MSPLKVVLQAKAQVDRTTPQPPACFYLGEPALPIAGTPAPLPCPFCGEVQLVAIHLEYKDAGEMRAHAECSNCGAETCGVSTGPDLGFLDSYSIFCEAARLWNERAPAKEVQS